MSSARVTMLLPRRGRCGQVGGLGRQLRATVCDSIEQLDRRERARRGLDRLEHGDAPLEEAIGLYQRGAALKKHCQDRLEAARLRVEQIVVGQAGQAERADPADFQ